MHGFFMHAKLHARLMSVADPFAYERWKKEQVQRKIKERRKSRITVRRRLPAVNKDLAEQLMEQEEKGEGGGDAGGDKVGTGCGAGVSTVCVRALTGRVPVLGLRPELQKARQGWGRGAGAATSRRQPHGGPTVCCLIHEPRLSDRPGG